METISIFGMPVKPEIDIGHLLTFVTLLAGFLWWLYTSIREWRRAARKDAESGALRLLLWLLRERQGAPLTLAELRTTFNADDLRTKRVAYCKRNFLFKADDEFERAIYQLDWEGKVDFVGAQAIAFRVDKQPDDHPPMSGRRRFSPTPEDVADALRILRQALRDPEAVAWKLRDTARTAYTLAPDETVAGLRIQMKTGDQKAQRVALDLMGELLPRA